MKINEAAKDSMQKLVMNVGGKNGIQRITQGELLNARRVALAKVMEIAETRDKWGR